MAYVLAVMAAIRQRLDQHPATDGGGVRPALITNLRLSLIAYAMRRTVWIAGFLVLIAAFLLQFLALHFGRLTTVQPILTLELPFLVAILGIWFRLPLTWREWVGATTAAAGLAAFLALSAPSGGNEIPDLEDWGIVSFAVIAGCSLSVLMTRFGSAAWRGRVVRHGRGHRLRLHRRAHQDHERRRSPGAGATSFSPGRPTRVGRCRLVGVFLAQNAFHAGPVTASQSALVIVDPLVSIAIGIGLFGDHVQTAGGRLVGEVLAMLCPAGRRVLADAARRSWCT